MLGSILGNVRESVESINGQPEGSAGGREDEITANDWDNTYGSNLTAGSWNDLAEFVVPAQNKFNVGYGKSDVEATVGRWFMVLDDGAGNEVTGVARLKTRNSNDENVDTEIRGVHTRKLNTDPTDYRKQYATAEQKATPKVGEDSKIVLQFNLSPDSAGTTVDFTSSNTVVQIPLTNYS